MKISRIKIRGVIPVKGLIGFVSLVIDDWLYLGNIAIFTRLSGDGIRLVFPQKKMGETSINIFYPLSKDGYYELEKAVQEKMQGL